MIFKKRKIRINLYLIIGVLAICLLSQFYFFTLTENDIENDLVGYFRLQNNSEVIQYHGIDMKKSNNDLTITAIYRVTLPSGKEKFYVISYMKSPIITRYERASALDITGNVTMEYQAPGYLKDSYFTVTRNEIIPHGYHDNRGLGSLVLLAFVVMVYAFRVILDKVTDKYFASKK